MTLNPFLAVFVILVGVALSMVGNRLLLVGGYSDVDNNARRIGFWVFTLGLFSIALVFIIDSSAVFQFFPSAMAWLHDFMYGS